MDDDAALAELRRSARADQEGKELADKALFEMAALPVKTCYELYQKPESLQVSLQQTQEWDPRLSLTVTRPDAVDKIETATGSEAARAPELTDTKTSSAVHLELALPRKNLTGFYDNMRRVYTVACNLDILPKNRPYDV